MAKYRSEWKYYMDNASLLPIRERLLAIMDRDAHANEEGKYEINSLYFDDFNNTCAIKNESGEGIRFKYRIRYYNDDSSNIYLEKKIKNNSFCNKRSCSLTEEQYNSIMNEDVESYMYDDSNKLLQEFCIDIISRGFRPKVIVSYEREAFVELINNIRITFDSSISASDSFDDFLKGTFSRIPIISDSKSVLEVKFDDVLPAYIRKTLQVESVIQRSFSKYYYSRIAIQDFHKIK